MTGQVPLISVEQARTLLMLLEQGMQEDANELLTDICKPNATAIFAQLGQLTRQLHTSLQEFELDPRLSALAEKEIPDAKDRLNYVIEMTDKAANRTMDAVESCLPLSDKIVEKMQEIKPAWGALMTRQLDIGQFKTLCHQLDAIIKDSELDADKLRQSLTEILMAQDFQDLTGQMIRKVIKLVQEVEDRLVDILTVFGGVAEPTSAVSQLENIERNNEAEGPIINKELRTDVVNNQDDVDDLLSSLGF